MTAPRLITDNLDLWTAAVTPKGNNGRGSNGQPELTGIKKLRQLILELAVRGKLVPQNPADEPASALLKKIAAEKARLVKEGKIKKPKPLPAVGEGEQPFVLPEGWEWTRLGTVFNSIMSGGTPSKNNPKFWGGDIPWASVKDLGQKKHIGTTQDFITQDGLKAGSKLADTGDILICTRMGLGKVAICDCPIAINQDLKAIKLSSLVTADFFLIAYSTLDITGTGTTVAGITQDKLLNYVVALPPLAEQHRIVEKVDELMALCDRLEQQTSDQLAAHETLVETLLDTLTRSSDATELATNWTRLQTHFDTLFTTESSIDRLKQTILQLAVMGRLVPQDPNDEPASALLEKIAAEKARLVKEGKIKKPKPLPAVGEDEQPFALPEGWAYCRLNEIGTWGSGATPKRGIAEYYGGDIPWFKSGELVGDFISSAEEKITDKALKETSVRLNSPGDVLIAMYGATIGKASILKCHATTNQAVCACTPFSGILNTYLLDFLKASKRHFISMGAGGAQPNISKEKIIAVVFPLPPLAEQRRIVEKIDELMILCDQLKKHLREADQVRQHLAETFMASTLA